ncbi:MAG: DAK2 domain-containing protein, partial [Clostridiales bacterium]|nr:DAK2 domain-containing protein [Clostridiales bacterium]
ISLVDNLVDDDAELISLYYGEEVTDEEATEIADELMNLYPDLDVEVHYGGQPIYYYLLSVE